MRNYIYLTLMVVFTVTPYTVCADSEIYWDYDIPIYNGGRDVSIKKDEKFCTYSVSYDLKINNTIELLIFYKNFFEKKGWSNPWEDLSSNGKMPLKWNGNIFNWNLEGMPEFIYSSYWKAQDIPVNGLVRVLLTGVSDGKFDAVVSIHMSPDIDLSPIFEFQERIVEDPRNIFLLHEAVQGNPFIMENFSAERNPKQSTNTIVQEYYMAVDNVLSQYREFYQKHIVK